MPDGELSPILPKHEHSREGSLSSIESSPGVDAEGELDQPASQPANVQVQKRKGGRKPIYATSEERKQRNRQAQAAFRERRTEYIKQLESTIKHQDETLQTLQQSHRSAADECLMLRYKNSLLERILLEKGVDVQAELKRKEIAAPGRLPTSLPQQVPIQRSALSPQHHAHRASTSSTSSLLPKRHASLLSGNSPQLHPTPTSIESSPTHSRSPIFGIQGGMNPPQAGYQAQPQPQQRQLQPQPRGAPFPGVSLPPSGTASQPTASHGGISRNTSRSGHWPSPYQAHLEQLEREYDAHADMLDDADTADEGSMPIEPYASRFEPDPQQKQPQAFQPEQAQRFHPQHGTGGHESSSMNGDFGSPGQVIDPYDPILDADPFGLTASMHFPTQFTFQESSIRK